MAETDGRERTFLRVDIHRWEHIRIQGDMGDRSGSAAPQEEGRRQMESSF